MTKVEKNRIWRHKLRQNLITQFGGCCQHCRSVEKLEFAHKTPNDICGMGRGSQRRLVGVKRDPANYMLLCKICHTAFDNDDIETLLKRQFFSNVAI